ncbi:hypothetical protein [Streptomyces uncialis]|uniref:hypothetical protein n=1 Tax=Streptomyces uncialis TaxID=1048205 RepID=UPI0022558AB3|nr:hypothetical protein [Streptomyces uncialis]MCX4662514.1 hypothetical protein [Streptomyces uncialis]
MQLGEQRIHRAPGRVGGPEPPFVRREPARVVVEEENVVRARASAIFDEQGVAAGWGRLFEGEGEVGGEVPASEVAGV